MRIAAALVVAGLAGGLAWSAGTTWRLLDDAGVPLAGVEVAIVGRTGSVRTADDGTFVLDVDILAPFEIVVFDGSGALVGTARVVAGPAADAREVRIDPAAIERVRVVGGVAPSTAAPPAAMAVSRSRDELERIRPAHVVDALSGIPGASAVGGGSTAVPALRGLARGRTLVLLDDARVTTERRAGASATFVDPFTIERLEIVRGPGSVAYGSDAFGGVVHMRTPEPRPDVAAWRAEGTAAAGAPSATIGVEGNVPIGDGAVLASVHARSFGDYESPEGEVPYSSARDAGVVLRGVVAAGRARILAGWQSDRAQDVERPATDTDVRVTSYPDELSDRFTASVGLPGGLGADGLELLGFIGRYELVTERETFASDDAPRTVEASDVSSYDAALRLDARRGLARGAVRWGIDATSRIGLSTVETVREDLGSGLVETERVTSIEDARRITAGVYFEGERPAAGNRVELFWGLRGDFVGTRNRGGEFGDRSTSDVAPSGHAAIRMRLGADWDVTVQAASGFRDPTLSDRYYVGLTGRGTVTGNPDLDPERSVQFDVTARGALGPAHVAGSLWRYRIRDLIERYEVAPDEFALRNRGAEDLAGVEVAADAVLARRWLVQGALGWTRGEMADTGEPAADVPAPSAYAAVEHRPGDRWWWRAEARGVLRDDRPGETEIVTPGSVLIGAGAGVRLPRGFELRLTIDNLFDRAVPASSDRRAPLGPGRSAALALTVSGERYR